MTPSAMRNYHSRARAWIIAIAVCSQFCSNESQLPTTWNEVVDASGRFTLKVPAIASTVTLPGAGTTVRLARNRKPFFALRDNTYNVTATIEWLPAVAAASRREYLRPTTPQEANGIEGWIAREFRDVSTRDYRDETYVRFDRPCSGGEVWCEAVIRGDAVANETLATVVQKVFTSVTCV